MVPEKLQPLYHVNPIAGLLQLFQTVLYEGAMPVPINLAVFGSISVIVFMGGWLLFTRFRRIFPEIL